MSTVGLFCSISALYTFFVLYITMDFNTYTGHVGEVNIRKTMLLSWPILHLLTTRTVPSRVLVGASHFFYLVSQDHPSLCTQPKTPGFSSPGQAGGLVGSERIPHLSSYTCTCLHVLLHQFFLSLRSMGSGVTGSVHQR